MIRISRDLWNYRNPQYPNSYSGGEVEITLPIRLPRTYKRASVYIGWKQNPRDRGVSFYRYRNVATHLRIGRLWLGYRRGTV